VSRLDFQKDPICEKTRKLVEDEFDRKRAEGKLSRVHDMDHVIAVSNFTGITARALMNGQGFDDFTYERAAILAAVAGNLHDYHREAKETEPHGPKGAEFFMKHTGNLNMSPLESTSVEHAILHHEMSIPELSEEFGSPIGVRQEMLPAVIAFALKTGDGILEASGYRVLERRAFFVGKERMLHGDLSNVFEYPNESDLAVIGESLRRLYGKLPIDSYPDWIKGYGEWLHSIQYKFLQGLLTYRDMTESEAAEYMERRGFPKFEGVKDKVAAQKHLYGKHFDKNDYPVLAANIEQIMCLGEDKDELAEASYQLVKNIAQAETPEDGIDVYGNFTPIGNPFAQDFYNGMSGYREGSYKFIADFETDVTEAVRRISGN